MKSFAQRLSTTLLFLARMVAKAKVTVSIGGSNVDYNGATRHIRLPSLPDDDVVARDLAIGLVLHESGHAAYSKMELYGGLPAKSYLRGLFNAIDDVQQERQVIRDWSGAGPALKATVAQLCNSGFFSEVDPTKPASVVRSYVLMHLRHVFLGQPCGHLAAHSRDAFTALFGVEKEAEFRDMLETDMSSVWSSQAALDLAKKVIAFFSDDQDDSDQCDSSDSGKGDDTDSGQDDAGDSGKGDDTDPGQDDAGNSGDSGKGDDTDSGQDDAGDSGDSGKGDDTDSGQDDAGNSGDSGKGDDTDSGQDDGPARKTQSPFTDGGDDLEELDLGQILSGQLEEISRRTLDSAASTLEIPMAMDIERGTFDELAETSVHSHALRGTLVNLIEASRKQPRSTGVHGNRFDRRKVWRYRLGDDKLRVKKQRRTEVNTAVWLMLDVSGSMTNLVELARRSMLAASLALEAIEGTRVGAACFPYRTGNRVGYYEGRRHDIRDGIGVMLTPGEPVRKNASRFMVEASGGTPLAEALWWSGSQLLALPEPRRMLFVFTDGEPDEPEKAEYAMTTLESVGIEVYGMAIGAEAQEPVEALFKRNALVTDMRDLQKAMFAMLKNAYLGAA
jgi:Mg-chelatase subunit ChlD